MPWSKYFWAISLDVVTFQEYGPSADGMYLMGSWNAGVSLSAAAVAWLLPLDH
jgi:hypothetical protein